MAGHSKRAKVKRRKAATNKKKSQLFSKLLTTVSIAARENPNLQQNTKLRRAIQETRNKNVPQKSIAKAAERAKNSSLNQRKFLLEAYGPGGGALLIKVRDDNKNKTTQEIKIVLSKHNAKLAEEGSVKRLFQSIYFSKPKPQFIQQITKEQKKETTDLIYEINTRADVCGVFSNTILAGPNEGR